MANYEIFMSRHYIPESAGGIWDRIIAAAEEHHNRYHTVPTLAHISVTIKDYPTSIGVIKVEPVWGLGANEIDLGIGNTCQTGGQA